MWQKEATTRIQHTDLGRDSDLILVAPATANTIGRVAAGLADTLLVSLIMASHTPVLFAPAMNVEMWNNPIVQRNLAALRALGRYDVVPPETGELACGVLGAGRLAPIPDIVAHARRALAPHDLAGRHVLVTAGPTREPIDPVRFVTNHSTGKMGYALAQAAWERGARVTLVSGPVDLPAPVGLERVPVTTAAQMAAAVLDRAAAADALLMVAAVADYRPATVATAKIKKTAEPRSLALERTTDILAAVSERRAATGRPGLVLGFAAETEDVEAHATAKLEQKGLDFILANHVGQSEGGFGDDRNAGVLLGRSGFRVVFPLQDKAALAHGILTHLATRMGQPT